ncbi:hypothetical protein AB0G79_15780 [Streptomyces sp. NPDC020807]|uniref:hypothetical protein n=1 Tax=Streptomyces sp. NPDC020807 TaxID=3155119 RepID=UPI0033C1ADE8
MSATPGRPTPAPVPTEGPALYAYAESLRARAPHAPPPPGGHPLPDTARPPARRKGLSYADARTAVTDALLPYLGAADPVRAARAAERALGATGVVRAQAVHAAAAAIDLSDEPAARARTRFLARRLVRTGTTVPGVSAGLGLLNRLGEPEDVPYLRALGLLDGLLHPVDAALAPLDREAAGLVWLSHRDRDEELRGLVDALAAGDRAAVTDLLVGLPTGERRAGPEFSRRIAEAVGLARLVREEPDRPGLLAVAVWLLGRMTSSRDYHAEILRYGDAVELYGTIAAHAHRLPGDVDHRAPLLTLALDLHSGASHLLPWPPGRREELHRALLDFAAGKGDGDEEASASSADGAGQAARRRAEWIRRTVRQLRAVPMDPPRFRVEVAVADPGEPDVVETRFLIDGRPLVPEAFGPGPGDPPERLLDSGALRAGPEPREVRLAEAYCTEGCCGALYVTVRREGGHVVWSDWRRPRLLAAARGELPAYRFDAAAYDAEIARAERDHGWTWPARRTARLVAAGLRDRPELLTGRGLRLRWISTDFGEPETTVVAFSGPPLAAGGPERGAGPGADSGTGSGTGSGGGSAQGEGKTCYFQWRLPDDGTPPERRAADALRRLAAEDPRRYPELRA